MDQIHNALRHVRDRTGLECRYEIRCAGNGSVSAAIWKDGVGCDHVTAAAARVDAGGQASARIAKFVAVLSEVYVRAVARGYCGRRRAPVETLLPLQQAAQLRAPIRPTVAVAIEHEQITFLQIDGW